MMEKNKPLFLMVALGVDNQSKVVAYHCVPLDLRLNNTFGRNKYKVQIFTKEYILQALRDQSMKFLNLELDETGTGIEVSNGSESRYTQVSVTTGKLAKDSVYRKVIACRIEKNEELYGYGVVAPDGSEYIIKLSNALQEATNSTGFANGKITSGFGSSTKVIGAFKGSFIIRDIGAGKEKIKGKEEVKTIEKIKAIEKTKVIEKTKRIKETDYPLSIQIGMIAALIGGTETIEYGMINVDCRDKDVLDKMIDKLTASNNRAVEAIGKYNPSGKELYKMMVTEDKALVVGAFEMQHVRELVKLSQHKASIMAVGGKKNLLISTIDEADSNKQESTLVVNKALGIKKEQKTSEKAAAHNKEMYDKYVVELIAAEKEKKG